MMRRNNLILYLLFLIPIIAILLIKNYAYYWDGVEYAWQVENSPWAETVHKHHLLYTPFCKAIYLLVTSLGISIRSIDLMAVINMVFGLVFLLLCYRCLKLFFPDHPIEIILGLMVIGFGYTFGAFLRNANQYVIPVTICTWLLLRILLSYKTNGRFKIGLFEWGLFFLTVLFHQMAIFLLPAIAFVQYMSLDRNRAGKTILSVCVFLGALFGTYLLIFFISTDQPSVVKFAFWTTDYARKKYWVFNHVKGFLPAVKRSVYIGLLSHKTLFVAPIERLALFLHDFQTTYGNKFIGGAGGWTIFFGFVILALQGLYRMYKSASTRLLATFLLWWILPFMAFFQVFYPYNSFYRLFYILPIVVFIVMGLIYYLETSKSAKILITCLLAGMLVINFIFGYIPESNPENNPYLVLAKSASMVSAPDDLFIFLDSDYHYGMYTRYFGDRDISFYWPLSEKRKKKFNPGEIRQICGETKNWLNDNYGTLYLAHGPYSDDDGFFQFNPTSFLKNPQWLIVHSSQIRLVEKEDIGRRQLNIVEITDLDENLDLASYLK
jgi:hypothetical protein